MNNPPIKVIILEFIDLLPCIIGGTSLYSAFKFDMESYVRVILIVVGPLFIFLSIFLLVKNDMKYGYYECGRCKEKFTPTMKDLLHASKFHYFENAREIRCPKCNMKTTCYKKY